MAVDIEKSTISLKTAIIVLIALIAYAGTTVKLYYSFESNLEVVKAQQKDILEKLQKLETKQTQLDTSTTSLEGSFRLMWGEVLDIRERLDSLERKNTSSSR